MKIKIQYNVISLFLVLPIALSIMFLSSIANAQSAQSSVPLVVTTIKPLAIIAKSALGGSATVEYLQSSGQSGHDLSLQVSALRKIDQADLVIWIGEDFEARVAKTFKKLPGNKLMTVLDLPLRHLSAEHHDGKEQEKSQDSTRHRDLTRDPHVWLNPHNANIIGERIQAQFGMPAADIISAAQIAQLQEQLQPYASQNYLSHHDALGHFVSAFKLQPSLSIRDASGAQQGAKTQYQLRQAAVEGRAQCIFVEPQYGDKDAKVMAQSLQLPLRSLDPQGFDQPLNKQAYSEFMRSLVVQFKACFD